MTIYNCDCRDGLAMLLEADSVDSIVTDPPYELGFMGKSWDSTGIANDPAMWREAFRVLKPGGHLLAFSGTRTYHRMVCAIEDAGFEIRDQIGWVYGSGFPKSLDVSKAIDARAGNDTMSTAPYTPEAQQWQGWGTALKPAWEPIVVARKPLIGTVAANVLAHGTGAINIDGCRVEIVGPHGSDGVKRTEGYGRTGSGQLSSAIDSQKSERNDLGRWPANLIHDGSDEVLACFPETKSGALSPDMNVKATSGWSGGSSANRVKTTFAPNEGSAARFFYCAKASKMERGTGNTHPTVKPVALMRYLLRLVTQPGGLAVDPFTGSGSTAVAAALEGFQFVGFELSAEYAEIARARVAAVKPPATK